MAEMAQMTPLATLCRVRMLNMRRYNGLGSVRLPLSGQNLFWSGCSRANDLFRMWTRSVLPIKYRIYDGIQNVQPFRLRC